MPFGHQQPSDPTPYDDPCKMVRRLEVCAERSIQYFLRNLNENGSYGNYNDLGNYAKLPNALIMCGYPKEANRVINYCLDNYFQEDGDFCTKPGMKSISAPFSVFYPYCNQWMIQAGLKLRRFDYVFKAAAYNDKFYNPITSASVINRPYQENGENINDIFTSAALGTTYLYLNNLERAKLIANTMVKMIDAQPDWNNKELGYPYYLRFTDDFKFIKYIAPEPGIRTIYKVQGDRIRQPYFSIGYPVAFMGFAYQVFGDKVYLKTAEKLIDYALRINTDVRTNQWAHKLMWGTSIVASETNKQVHWDLVYDIANTIMNSQDPNTGCTSSVIDQTAEMAFWMPIIAMKIRQTKRKFGRIGDGKGPKQSKL
eukprot:471513_1